MVSFVSTLLAVSAVTSVVVAVPTTTPVIEKRLTSSSTQIIPPYGSTCEFIVAAGAALTYGASVVLPGGDVTTGQNNMFNVYGGAAITGLALGGEASGKQSCPTVGHYGSSVYTTPNSIATGAQKDLVKLIAYLSGLSSTGTAPDGSVNVLAGVYTYAGANTIPSLVLQGSETDVFIFAAVGATGIPATTKITLVTKTGSSTAGTGAGNGLPLASNIIFYSGGAVTVGAAATVIGSVISTGASTIGAGAVMTSSIMSLAAITVGANAVLTPAFINSAAGGTCTPVLSCSETINNANIKYNSDAKATASASAAAGATLYASVFGAYISGGVCNP